MKSIINEGQSIDFRFYEEKLVDSLSEVFQNIIVNNLINNISSKSRAGAEISDFLEDKFVEYITEGNNNSYLSNAVGAPKGSTKNPYDAKCDFVFLGRKELIWIDIKAFKISSKDSNPDSGTVKKVIKFIKEGNFYLIYVYVYYDAEDDGIKFVKYNNTFTKLFLLKDVDSSVRITPSNQLQINIISSTIYRTRLEFIAFLRQKHTESLKRTIKKKEEELKVIDDVYDELVKITEISTDDF